MSSEAYRTLARRFVEDVWDKGDLAAVEEVFARDVVDHHAVWPAPGVEGQKQLLTAFRTAFPDLHVTSDDILVDGDRIVVRWIARGTHQGELLGIPATGKQVTITGIDILRIAGGKIVERWAEDNGLALMQQLGVVPSPGQASA